MKGWPPGTLGWALTRIKNRFRILGRELLRAFAQLLGVKT